MLSVMMLALLVGVQGGDPAQPGLDAILEREAEYCQRLESVALDFVCLEDITEKIDQSKDIATLRWQSARDRPPTSVKRTFLYDFQFVRKGLDIEETRTLLKKNGKETVVRGAALETGNFVYKNAVLAPIGIFGARWREAFSYRISGEGKVGGRSCLIVEAVPKGPSPEIDFLSGRSFIDKTTLEILKIEWSQQRIGNYEAFEKRAKRYGMKPKITVTSEFEVEKNGIRFPSRHLIEEAYFGVGGMSNSGRFVRSRTTVIYREFRFFTVSVERTGANQSVSSSSPTRAGCTGSRPWMCPTWAFRAAASPWGRTASGVRGIRLKPKVIGMIVVGPDEKFIFTATDRGYGKKTASDMYPIKHRGGQGVLNLRLTPKIGHALGMVGINEEDLLVITVEGKVIGIPTTQVRSSGRATQGVRIINLNDKDRVCSIAKVRES